MSGANKRIIVTGGAGFIGSNFVFHMLEAHPRWRIICLDKLTYAGNLKTLESVMGNPRFRFVKADICDREAVYKLFAEERPDIVVNFAAESHVDRSIENPSIFLETNIIWTSVLRNTQLMEFLLFFLRRIRSGRSYYMYDSEVQHVYLIGAAVIIGTKIVE